MFAIVGLGAITLVGLLLLGAFTRRALVESARLRAQVELTRGELEPRYTALRARARDARMEAR